MSQEGQRHAEELARLEARKKDLEDTLMRLARDEAEAQESSMLALLQVRCERQPWPIPFNTGGAG